MQGPKLVGILDLALRPFPGSPGFHVQDPDVVEDVGRAAAAAEDEKSVVAEVKLTLAVTRLRPGFRDVFLGPAAS